MQNATIVHVQRHGQVENPSGVLYGRLPGFGLSELGHRMAARMAEHWRDAGLTHLRVSPLQRAQETIAPTAALHPDLEVTVDERVIEAANEFEGLVFGRDNAALRNPRMFWHMRNPMRPSWGESYIDIASRMRAAILDAAEAAGPGGQALVVSHQLPIWIARRAAENRSFVHDPRRRECTLCSVTRFAIRDGLITGISYTEPAADLLPLGSSPRRFRVGT